MKYKGRILGPREIIVPVIRSEEEGGNIIFKLRAVVDLAPLLKACPPPDPPFVLLPGNKRRFDPDNAAYKAMMDQWWKKRSDWIAIQSMRTTEGLEWDRVQYDNPDTWCEWAKELAEAGFADAEIQRIVSGIMDVNGLNENLIEEARMSFLTTAVAPQNGQSSHKEEVPTTPSGGPATA